MLKISIVVPVLNRVDCVERTLDSIAASTHRGFELLIVDNGSTDGTLALCQQWAWAHRDDGFPIRVLSELQQNASSARNRGLMECRTEFIYFFDSDDLFSADFMACILPELSEELDVLCVPIRQEVGSHVQTRAYRTCSDVHIHLLNAMLNTLSMVLRTDYLRSIGGWNETLTTWDDWELGVRVLLGKPRLRWYTQNAFHHVLVHSESQTGESFSATLPAITKTMRVVLELLQAAHLQERKKRRNLRAFYFRCMIYAGILRREKNEAGTKAFRALAMNSLPHATYPLRKMGMLLSTYSAIGGRGAWRIAVMCV